MNPRLFLLQPTVVFRAQINQTVFTYPMAELMYDTVTVGAYTDIKPGMTMVISSAIGEADGGRQRIRKAADATKVYFGRSSRGIRDGELDPSNDWYIEVWDDYRVWAKVPQMPVAGETVTTYKDHDLAVGTYTTNPPPIANLGPGFAGTMNPVSEVAVVNFAATNSWAVADGATITTYLWNVEDGTITFGSTATEIIEVEFPAGFRWVELTVTDSNSNSHTARAPVYVRDPAADTSIAAFEINQHRITPQGQEISVDVRPDVLAEYSGGIQYPDGTLAMIWNDDVSPNADKQGMMFIGWHQVDPATISAGRLGRIRTTRLDLVDVAGKLDTLPGFPQVVSSDLLRNTTTHAAITWEYMISPTIQKYVHYLLHWHSTALELADLRFRGTTAATVYPFLILESSGMSLFDQVAQRVQQLTPDHVLTCTRRGQLAVWPDPMLLDPVDRTEAYQGSITDAEWSDIQYTHLRSPRVHWLRGGAIVGQSSVTYDDESGVEIPTVFCIAPGEAPGQGEQAQEENERLAISQDDLNRTIGHKYARVNAPESYFTIDLVGSSDQGLEPADLEWVWLKLTPDEAAQRGMFFETMAGIILVYEERGLIHEINIRYDYERHGLTRDVQLVWERELDGPPAVTVIPPVSTTDPGTGMDDDHWDYNPGEIEYPTVDIWAGLPKAYVMWSSTHVVRTWDILAASPTWELIDTGITGTIFDARYVHVGGSQVGLWLRTRDGIWWCSDIMVDTPTWTKVLSIETIRAAEATYPTGFESRIQAFCDYASEPGYLIVATGPYNRDGVGADGIYNWQHSYTWHTHDYGQTWTMVDMTGYTWENLGYTQCFHSTSHHAIEIFRSAPGTIYLIRATAAVGTSNRRYVFQSSDGGHTWTQHYLMGDTANNRHIFSLLHPFPSASDSGWLTFGDVGVTNRPDLYVSTDEFDTVTRKTWFSGEDGLSGSAGPTNTGGVESYGFRPNKRTYDPDHLMAWFYDSVDTQYDELWETNDRGDTWTKLYEAQSSPSELRGSVPSETLEQSMPVPCWAVPNGWPGDQNYWFLPRCTQVARTNPTYNVIRITTDNFQTVEDRSGNLFDLLDDGVSTYWWNEGSNSGIALPKVGPNA